MLHADADNLEAAPELSPIGLGRASVTYALGGLAYKGIALLAVPLLARLLDPAQLGLLDMAAVIASLVSLTVMVGTDQGVAYWEMRLNAPARVWGSALTVVAVGAFAAAALLVVAREPAAALLVGNPRHGFVIAAAGVYGGVMALSAFMLATIRLRAEPSTYAVAAFLTVLFEMAGAVAIALTLPDPVPWMVLAWAVGSALVGGPFLARYLPRLAIPTTQAVRALVRYGVPLVPVTISWIVGDLAVRAVLGQSTHLADLGRYGIAFRITSALGLLSTGFGIAWYAYLYASPETDVQSRARSAAWTVVLLLGAGALVLTLLAPELVLLVAGERYAGAAQVVAPLGAGALAVGVFHLAAGLIGRTGATVTVGAAAVAGGVAQIVLALLIVPASGLMGAGIAAALGQTLAMGILLAVVARQLDRETFLLLAGAGLALVAAHLLQAAELAVRAGLVAVLVGGVAVSAYRACSGRTNE